MNYRTFVSQIALVALAHQGQAKPDAKTYRTLLSGDKNPYFTHPLWCAMMILLESELPESIRIPGAYALLWHDVLEDTTGELPEGTSEQITHFVQEMTYEGGFEEERHVVLNQSPEIQLLKLYDKTATLYDGALAKGRYGVWTDLVEKLADATERRYGTLNIVLLARSLVVKYRALI